MQERRDRVIGVGAARVRFALAHPPVRIELFGVGSPERVGGVDGPRGDDDGGAGGDEVACDGGVALGLAEREGHRGEHAGRLVYDGVEVVQMVDVCRQDLRGWVADGGELGEDFLAQTRLRGGVLTHEVDGPGQGGGGCFVARGEEGHELVDEIFVGEATGFDGYAEDVGIGTFAFGELLAFGPHEVAGYALDGADGFFELFVALHGEGADQPFGEEHGGELHHFGGGAGLEDGAVGYVELVGWVGDGIEILPHTREPDDVECRSRGPFADLDNRRIGRIGLQGIGYGVGHLDGLGPERGVQIFDMSERKSG